MHTIVVYANSLCRNCDHNHSAYSGCSGIMMYGRRFSCLCGSADWAPKDNLEYLEWLVKKRGN
jgi:hypothetical protein